MTVLRIRSSLHKRPETSNLQYRKVIPEKLKPYFGKTAIIKSFKTADPAVARIRHHELSTMVEAQIASAWGQYRGDTQVEETQLHHMADRWYQSQLDYLKSPAKRDELVVDSVMPRGNGQAPVLDREHVWSLNLQSPPEANTLRSLKNILGNEAEELLRQSGTALRLDSRLYHQLLILLADRALRIAGQAGKSPSQAPSSAKTPNNQPPESPTLSELWASYQRHYGDSGNPKDRGKVNTYRSDFSKFIQHAGNSRLSMLNRGQAISFRDALREIPDTTAAGFRDKAGMSASDFRELPLDQQRDIAAEENLTVRTASGVKTALKRAAAILAWADKEHQTKYNVLNPIPEVPNSQTEKRGEAFEYSPDEIRTLLTSNQILGALSVDELWCMLVLYYTGARLREITPMLGEDLLIVGGNEGLHIREEHKLGRTVKNKASIRKVPVHPHLKELGFLRYAERPPRNAMFPDLWDTSGNRANKFSRKLKSLGLDHDFKPTVRPSHGFRHHVIGLWRNAEKRQDLQDAYLGHTQRSQQAEYSGFSAVAKGAGEVWPELPDKEKLMAYLWPEPQTKQ